MSSQLLLDEDGTITEQFENVLKRIFLKYRTPKPAESNSASLPPTAFISQASLDKWATDTNGAPLPEEQKEEIREYMDVNEDGNLTLKGFMQIYQLQTENDENETWKDLQKHGFDRTLKFQSTSATE